MGDCANALFASKRKLIQIEMFCFNLVHTYQLQEDCLLVSPGNLKSILLLPTPAFVKKKQGPMLRIPTLL